MLRRAREKPENLPRNLLSEIPNFLEEYVYSYVDMKTLERVLLLTKMDEHEKAVAELFEKYKNLVFRTAYLMYGNREEAEEALQEVFLQVYRFLPGYDPAKGAMSTWLHRITINYCLRHRQDQKISIESLDELEVTAPEESIEAHLQASMDAQSIRDAILNLSAKLRAVIILRYFWDLSYNEISEVLVIPLGTVKSRIDLALRTLGTSFQSSSSELTKDASSILERVL
jgi:RNA polymerase sigma-70 factor (ECF subfamily)